MALQVGYAVRDITPSPGLTMSGFAARCNLPAEGTDDPLVIHALYFEADGRQALLLVFDLLAIGPELLEAIHQALDQSSCITVPRAHRLFCCTHTHSAPAAITLIGCGIPDAGYWQKLCRASVDVAEAAISRATVARIRLTSRTLVNSNFNRRKQLTNHQVVMTESPSLPVIKEGPDWPEMLFLRFETIEGEPIACAVHWAAHPATVCGSRYSADFPGELCRRLALQHGMPFLFLQGACGNINAPRLQKSRKEMLDNVDELMCQLCDITWPQETVLATPFQLTTTTLPLLYASTADEATLRAFNRGMAEIAATGHGPDIIVAELANILNVAPGESVDPALLRYIAGNMRDWSDMILHAAEGPSSCDIGLAVLRIGRLVFCFIAAETFVETAIALQEAIPDQRVITIGYMAPLIGYLPTDEAIRDGGYEVNSAYRFYAHPAPFLPGAESMVRERLVTMIEADDHLVRSVE